LLRLVLQTRNRWPFFSDVAVARLLHFSITLRPSNASYSSDSRGVIEEGQVFLTREGSRRGLEGRQNSGGELRRVSQTSAAFNGAVLATHHYYFRFALVTYCRIERNGIALSGTMSETWQFSQYGSPISMEQPTAPLPSDREKRNQGWTIPQFLMSARSAQPNSPTSVNKWELKSCGSTINY
jgi:hypothetical protein